MFSVCDSTYISEIGNITSFDYPKPHTTGVTCKYLINQPMGFLIVLNFTDFEVGSEPGPDGRCPDDYMEVRKNYYTSRKLWRGLFLFLSVCVRVSVCLSVCPGLTVYISVTIGRILMKLGASVKT